jgi:5-(aminomethyl)-3-furanmethanol phosphate kinase
MIVVKVGGSLYDLPDLKPRLNAYLQPLAAAEPVIVVPGGGPLADVVRDWHLRFKLAESTCDYLAQHSMFMAAFLLGEVIDAAALLPSLADAVHPGIHLYLAKGPDPVDDNLPRTWAVTSDSIAVSVAILMKADRLILLKSADPPTHDYAALAAAGYVDAHFPIIISQFDGTVEFVNLRSL